MMSVVRISELYAGKRNFVFLGEAGSGKTQIAINFAFAFVREQSCAVQLFDMDQTKTGFRARDFAQQLNAEGISLRWQPQFFDAPTVVSGVDESLRDSGCFTLLDVGAVASAGVSSFLSSAGVSVRAPGFTFSTWSTFFLAS